MGSVQSIAGAEAYDMKAIITVCELLNYMAEELHSIARSKGFWDEKKEFGTSIALIHSEISESLEGHRQQKKDEHCPEFDNWVIELADAIIRILDLAGSEGVDIGGALLQKAKFNTARPKKHGKAY